MELIDGEAPGLFDVRSVENGGFQAFEMVMDPCLDFGELADEDLAPALGAGFAGLGEDVVDVADQHEVGAPTLLIAGLVLEVLEQRAVASWPEQQGAVVLAEGVAFGVDGQGVGCRTLEGEADLEADAVALL